MSGLPLMQDGGCENTRALKQKAKRPEREVHMNKRAIGATAIIVAGAMIGFFVESKGCNMGVVYWVMGAASVVAAEEIRTNIKKD